MGLLVSCQTVAAMPPQDLTSSAALSDRLTRLARVHSELVRAKSIEEVSQAVVTHGAAAVGASVSTMTLANSDGETARLIAINGGQPDDPAVWGTFPLTARIPSAEGIRRGVRFTVGRAEFVARYPQMTERGIESAVVLPLRIADRTMGTVVLSFTEEREFDAAELEFLDILADTCAQGVDRITAKQEAARQSAKLAFLAETANELTSLDYETTLANVARLAVPTFADWSAIDLVEDGRLRRLAVAHVDPAKVQMAHDLAARYPPDPNAQVGAWEVMRTGRSELISVITDEMLVAGAVDDEHLAIARALHLRSALTVPLVARERVLGVLTWVTAESERHYTQDDLELAEAVAKRAAVSIDNSELHSQTMAAAVQLQEAVLPQTLQVSEGWNVSHHYSPSGRTEVGGDFYDVIELEDGRLVLFVGDVMGRGVAAAAAMAQTRAAVRAYAALDPDPAVVLKRLDQMYAHYQSDQMVTLLYAVVDPVGGKMLLGNAGHPPPLLLHADATVTQLPFAEGAPLGVGVRRRHRMSVPFLAGDTVIAFTDGLIERRDEDITDGQARLARAVTRLAGRDLAESLSALADAVCDPSRDDDVAVLAVRRRV
jgi:serine phosphatase RsbU (regulator of sigma subunit)